MTYRCSACNRELHSTLPKVLENVRVSFVMPVYNEAGTVAEIVQKVLDLPIDKELIIVDDGSTDGTSNILDGIRDDRVSIYRHRDNRGKSAALRTGFSHVTGDVVMIQDADLEYDPSDCLKLIEPIADGRADVVYGSRFIGEPHRVLLFWHYVGNRLITFLTNMLCNLNLTDASTCYKVFRTSLLNRLSFCSEGFGWDAEFTVKASRLRCRIYEVAISYSGRDYEAGKKITWKDGILTVFQILRHALFSGVRKKALASRSLREEKQPQGVLVAQMRDSHA